MRSMAWVLAILVLTTLAMATVSRAAAPISSAEGFARRRTIATPTPRGHRPLRAENVAGGLHRAGLVVDYGDGWVFTFCIPFTGTHITGLDLLQRAGLPLVEDGGAVCMIGDTGCPTGTPCFCACMGPPPCTYWSYWVKDAAATTWTFSTAGAADRRLSDGDVDGWSWSDGAPPPNRAFDDLCGPLHHAFLPSVYKCWESERRLSSVDSVEKHWSRAFRRLHVVVVPAEASTPGGQLAKFKILDTSLRSYSTGARCSPFLPPVALSMTGEP